MEKRAPAWFRWTVGLLLLAALALGGRWLLVHGIGNPERDLLGARIRLLHFRVEVLRFRDARGTLPEVLEDTLAFRGAAPLPDSFKFHRERGKQACDTWDRSLAYSKDGEKGTFEIRSAGPDGAMGTPDDLFQQGRAGEDLAPLAAELQGLREEYDRRFPPRDRRRKRRF